MCTQQKYRASEYDQNELNTIQLRNNLRNVHTIKKYSFADENT